MELIKESINMSKILCNTTAEVYINEEIVIPESNQSIEGVIKEVASAVADEIKVRDDQIKVRGVLDYAVLYVGEENGTAQGTRGQVPFEEMVRMPGIKEDDEADIRIVVESVSVKAVNSRKFLIKAELRIYAMAQETVQQEVAVDVSENKEASVLKKKLEALSLVSDKSDIFKIKDEFAIPSAKSSVNRIVWRDIKIKNVTTKLIDKMMHIGGEIYVFVMYIPDDDGIPQQWHEATMSFGGTIDMPEVSEDMISYVDVKLQNAALDLIADDEGENREISVDVVLKLMIKVYKEKEIEVLSDIYSPYINIVPVYSTGLYHKLLVKNSSRSKNVIKLGVDQSKGNILQICNSGADVKIENITVTDDGLLAEGKIKAYVIYVSTNDKEPLCTACEEAKFSHKIDAEGITKEDEYYINWRVEQVTANMVSTDEIEIKAVVVMEAIVFKKCSENVITELNEEPLDLEKIAKMPTVKGHVVQQGETLWKLAKDNYTTMEKLKMVNNLKSDQIKKGDRLLIMKAVRK